MTNASRARTISRAASAAQARGPATGVGAGPDCRCNFSERKERQLLFHLVRQLAEAQFMRADRARTAWLWQEVASLGIDPERVTRLLYGGQDLSDSATLEALDSAKPIAAERISPPISLPGLGWLRQRGFRSAARADGHRIAPPESVRGRRAVR